jgi:hypothetical protein
LASLAVKVPTNLNATGYNRNQTADDLRLSTPSFHQRLLIFADVAALPFVTLDPVERPVYAQFFVTIFPAASLSI